MIFIIEVIFVSIMFPLNFLDLSLFFAILSLILLVTSGVLSSESAGKNVLINTRKLRKAALVVSTLFVITVALRMFSSILLG